MRNTLRLLLLNDPPVSGGLTVPLSIIIAVVSALAGALTFFFGLYRKSQADLIIEKDKRHQDALEYERTLSALKERLASRRDGHANS